MARQRLQKILAHAGYGSRRECEELIVEGRVTVNDTTVSVLGAQADPSRDEITVDGERVSQPKLAYWVYNKAEGVFFSEKNEDDAISRVIKGQHGRLFTVGRLDKSSRGIMLITNDGRIGNILTHPRYRVAREYHISVKGYVKDERLRHLNRALFYAMNKGRFEPLSAVKRSASRSVIKLVAYEGLPPSLGDIFLKYQHAIKHIERVRIGCLSLDANKGRRARKLTTDEVTELTEFADAAEKGLLAYENDLVTPAQFKRGERAPNFKRKKTGHRGTSSGGQKKTLARVKRKPSGGANKRRTSQRRRKA